MPILRPAIQGRIKPALWNIDPALVDPAWRWLWGHPALRGAWVWGQNNLWLDAGPRRLHLAVNSGTPERVIRRWGDGVEFVRASSETMDVATSNFGPALTLAFVVQPRSVAHSFQWWVAHDSGANDGWRLGLAGDALGFTFGGVATYTGPDLLANTAYAIVMMCTGSGAQVRFWVRPLAGGAISTVVRNTGTMIGTPAFVEVGGLNWTSNYGDVVISHVLYWSEALTALDATPPPLVHRLLTNPFGPFRPARRTVVFVPAGGTTFEESMSGSVTPTGALVRQSQTVYVGGVTPSAIVDKLVGKLTAGTITGTAALARLTDKPVAGSVTATGLAAKLTSKPVAGSVTPTGVLGTLKVVVRTFTGAVTATGALFRQPQKGIGGTVTPSGTTVKDVARTYVGVVTASGALAKAVTKAAFTGAVTAVGALTTALTALFDNLVTGTVFLARRLSGSVFVARISSGVAKIARTLSGDVEI